MTEMPYDERRLQLVREADGENVDLMQSDATHYCPPLDAPMSVQQRRFRAAMSHEHGSVGHYGYGITDANAPRVLRAIFRDDAERKDFGAALAVWACVMGSGILLAYILHWAWTALTGGV